MHTPGPWIWTNGEYPVDAASYESPGYYDNLQLQSSKGKQIVSAGGGEYCPISGLHDSSCVESIANARLIAAAPELLEALKNMLTALRVVRDGRASAWDALVTPDLCTQWDRAKAAIAKAERKS